MNPNVLFVTVDSLRADYVSCIADSPVDTPGIDAVAEDGTTYTNAYAQGPFTTFSMPSLFTGRYPSALTYTSFAGDVVGVYLTEGTMLAEAVSDKGYRTAGFHSNPLLSNLFEFDRGFDTFDADLPFSGLSLPGSFKLLTNKLRRLLRTHAYIPAETITDRAIEWTDEQDSEDPLFLWTHYMDVHGPYQRKDGFVYYNKFRGERLWQKAVHSPEDITDKEHRELLETYREEVAYTDSEIGRLVETVTETTDRPTLVIITADHGDGFDEHGYYSHPHRTEDVLLNVPLVIDDPTGTLEDGVVTEPTELISVAPTVLDIVGADTPSSFEGTSLVARDESDPIAIGEAELTPDYRAAFVSSEYKYVLDKVADKERLYARTEADLEGKLVTNEADEQLERFRDIAATHRNRDAVSDQAQTSTDIKDDEVRDRLKKLGYME
ncbi:sulfatase [Halorientalis pallida]|uniref:Sulfatase N-terminal domain-containing protein n=1 Tax=Halorientalis pallida TaxID=2479928 RepID=A0A498KTK8_9EURY|nr:sulfatase [Halorientalis pallida]RXK47445.1 hypothetical protein EAF64_16860 [Halorientalis pallida]